MWQAWISVPLPAKDPGAGWLVLMEGSMDPISVEYLDDWQGTAPKGGIMIDIGAHIGLWTV